MGKKKAPEYSSSTVDSGSWGSSTADKNGIRYSSPNWSQNTMNTIGSNLNSTLQGMLSNDYSNDPNFQAYQNKLNSSMAQNYDTSVLSQLANRGLMRSSGLQSATNAFADTLADKTTDLYDSYYNRQANNLSNMLNTSNTLYNYMMGLNNSAANQANNVSNYNYRQTLYNNANNPSLLDRFASMNNGAVNGAQAGSAGGPWGALAGGIAGGIGGALSSQGTKG